MSHAKCQKRIKKSATALTAKGARLIDHRRFTAALRYLNQALKLEPDNSRAPRFRGLVYRERRQFNRAKRDLIQAVNLNPDSSANHLFLGVFLVDRFASRWGLYHLEQALTLTADRYDGTENCAHLARLYAYHQLEEDIPARAVCRELLKVDPREPCHHCLHNWLTLRISCHAALQTDSQTRHLLAQPTFSGQCGDWPGLFCHFDAWRLISVYVIPQT